MIKAIQENTNTEDVEAEYVREVYTNKVELCLATVGQTRRTRDNPRWLEKAMPQSLHGQDGRGLADPRTKLTDR
jgi:hypothetical protein